MQTRPWQSGCDAAIQNYDLAAMAGISTKASKQSTCLSVLRGKRGL